MFGEDYNKIQQSKKKMAAWKVSGKMDKMMCQWRNKQM